MKASVIICTYNRSVLLKESLRSVQAQDFLAGQFEIIVVDNNSTDDTRQVVMEFAASSSVPTKYIFEPQQGLSDARNAGIHQAEGEIIVFTDDDIEAEKSWLRELILAFDGHDVACAGGPIKPIWGIEKPEWLTERWQSYLTISEFPSVQKSGEFKGPEYPWGANMAFRKEVFTTIGMFPSELGRTGACLLSNEEIILCRRIEERGKHIRFAPGAVIFHKIPAARLTKQWFYHRTYWQGRSDAVLDMQSDAAVYSRLRQRAAEMIWKAIDKNEDDFSRVCFKRLAQGYLHQLLLPDRNDGQNFRMLRKLETFFSEIAATSSGLTGNKIEELQKYIDEKHEDLKRYSVLVKQKDEQLKKLDEEISRSREDFDARLKGKEEKIGELIRYIDEKHNDLKRHGILMKQKDEAIRMFEEQIRQEDERFRRERAESGIEKSRIEEEVKLKDAEIARKDELIKKYINSASWKITAPLRAVYDVVRRLSGK